MATCDSCACKRPGYELIPYWDEETQKLQGVCKECDADIQWVRNPPFPPMTKTNWFFGGVK